MLYTQQNYARKSIDHAKDGDIFEGCNLSQALAGTMISEAKDLVFRDCNLTNVAVDKSWQTPGCNVFQGDLPPEPDQEEAAAKESIIQEIVDRYAEEVRAQAVDMKAEEIDKATLEASVIEAVSAKPIGIKPAPIERLL